MNRHCITYKVGKFPQLTRKVFGTADGLKSDNITSLAADKNGILYIGTDKGLAKLDGDKLSQVDTGIRDACISDVFFSSDGRMFVCTGNRLLTFDGSKKDCTDFSSKTVAVRECEDGALWILTENVLYKKYQDADGFDIEIGVPGKGSCVVPYKNGRAYVGTSDNGICSLVGKRWHWCELNGENTGIVSDNVNCIFTDNANNVIIGTDKGVCVYDDNSLWLDSGNTAGLPSACINDIAFAVNGDRYYASKTGLIHQHNGNFSYYGYKRWLPSPKATAVEILPDGTVCVGTDKGLSVISSRMLTLEEKAFELRAMTEKYNVRKDGYVLDRALEHEGVVSLDEGYIPTTDNDGLRTGLYTAALCFEYACTKNEEVRLMAKRSLHAMIKLCDITGIDGFPARAIRYADERDYGTGVRHEWHVTKDADGNELEWLGETSSDELVGHFYCYANYYDLASDEEDKALIRSTVVKILDHILSHDFRLVDTDGVPTTWANWNPDLLNNDNKWIFEKGTNSLQILTFLKIGYHITGDEKYEKMFTYLADDRHYAMNLMQYRIPDGHLCHIDDNHDFLMISLLMKYTDDAKLRSLFAMGLSHHWADEKEEKNAFFNFVYGMATGERFEADDAIDELTDYPMDHVAWSLYNSHRPDLKWNMTPVSMGMVPQLYTPLSAHERRIVNNDINRFVADSGADDVAENIFAKSDEPTAYNVFPSTGNDRGMEFVTCTNYTHPYWFARYYGLIEE